MSGSYNTQAVLYLPSPLRPFNFVPTNDSEIPFNFYMVGLLKTL